MSDIKDTAKDTATAIGNAAAKVASGASTVASEAPKHKWAVVGALATIVALVIVGIVLAGS